MLELLKNLFFIDDADAAQFEKAPVKYLFNQLMGVAGLLICGASIVMIVLVLDALINK